MSDDGPPTIILADPTTAAEQYLRDICQQIADLEREAHDDFCQYEEEHRERRRDRHHRLYCELEPLRKMREALTKELGFAHSLDRVRLTVSAQAGVTLGEDPKGLRERSE